MLNLKSKTQENWEQRETKIEKDHAKIVPPMPIKKVPTLGLNLDQIKKKDFHDEFMEKYDEYSESWREMMKKQQRF